MRSAIIFSAIAFIHGAVGYAYSGSIPVPGVPGVFRRDDSFLGTLLKRQEICDKESGLSCRVGEYCIVIDGRIGCCPNGSVCNGIRTCVDHSTEGCERGGTLGNAVCCDAKAPYCNRIGSSHYCDISLPPLITTTVTITTTVCPYANTTTTIPSCPSPTASTTVSYSYPTLTPYPTDDEPEITPTLPPISISNNTMVVTVPISNATTTSDRAPSQTSPLEFDGAGVASKAGFSAMMGGLIIALLAAL
ncbi:hypothetical protein BDZ91DRAFT_846834 [Kalaharituber pfeilii]|nr:hypothetical protein BDZ91DRAFT_846834 [Kalaharituber pfeilii]